MQCLRLTTVTACERQFILLMDMILCLICLHTILGSYRRLTITSLEGSVTGNSLADHLVYYGVGLMAETWRSCKIVMDTQLKEYGDEDGKGNLMLSWNPSASALSLPSDYDARATLVKMLLGRQLVSQRSSGTSVMVVMKCSQSICCPYPSQDA